MTCVVAAAAGCGGGRPHDHQAVTSATSPVGTADPASTVTRSFAGMGLAFRYTAAWRAYTWSSDVSSFSALIVFLSNERIGDPCSRTGDTMTCGEPIQRLGAGGVLVRWSAGGFPDWHAPAPDTVIAGRRAAETRSAAAGWCADLGGSEAITAVIPTVPDNWFEMDACLRAPGASAVTAVAAMLRSLRIARGY